MECLQRLRFGWSFSIKYPSSSPIPRSWKPAICSSIGDKGVVVLSEDEVVEAFVRERRSSGDLVSRVSDMFWQREIVLETAAAATQHLVVEDKSVCEEGGFLKLSATQEWVSAGAGGAHGNNSKPRNNRNRKATAKGLQDERDARKRLNLLKYEAIKRELWVLSIGIGAASTAYCLILLSPQAALSYATGVAFSCVYLQLLYKHADELGREQVPLVFRQKKTNKIGIRSDHLQDLLERSIKGTAIALSSPRLVVPAAIYGVWILCHRYISTEWFDFQIVPAMLGMFVYKAAALVQVYRDNQDLQLVFPENDE